MFIQGNATVFNSIESQSLATFGGNFAAKEEQKTLLNVDSITQDKASVLVLEKSSSKIFDKFLITISICASLLVFALTNMIVFIQFNVYLIHPLFSFFLIWPNLFLIITALVAKGEE